MRTLLVGLNGYLNLCPGICIHDSQVSRRATGEVIYHRTVVAMPPTLKSTDQVPQATWSRSNNSPHHTPIIATLIVDLPSIESCLLSQISETASAIGSASHRDDCNPTLASPSLASSPSSALSNLLAKDISYLALLSNRRRKEQPGSILTGRNGGIACPASTGTDRRNTIFAIFTIFTGLVAEVVWRAKWDATQRDAKRCNGRGCQQHCRVARGPRSSGLQHAQIRPTAKINSERDGKFVR